MQVELYIDVFFLTNFVMDYLLLQIARRVLKCSATHGGILLGALAGAAGACLLVCLPLPVLPGSLLFPVLTGAVMARIGLGTRRPRDCARALACLYLSGFLLGGILTWLRQYAGGRFRIGVLFAGMVIVSCHLTTAGLHFLERFFKMREALCEVTLYQGETQIRVKAIVDSGNQLRDALTGKPVNIVSRRAAERLAGHGKVPMVRYIPYHTIQEGESVLPVITADKMCLHGSPDKTVEKPLLGISGQSFGNGDYEMILHPEDC